MEENGKPCQWIKKLALEHHGEEGMIIKGVERDGTVVDNCCNTCGDLLELSGVEHTGCLEEWDGLHELITHPPFVDIIIIQQ